MIWEEDVDERDTPDCPGMGMDDLCTWPDYAGCGLCTLGLNPTLFDRGPEDRS